VRRLPPEVTTGPGEEKGVIAGDSASRRIGFRPRVVAKIVAQSVSLVGALGFAVWFTGYLGKSEERIGIRNVGERSSIHDLSLAVPDDQLPIMLGSKAGKS